MGGGSDVFLTKFTPGSSALLFSTYLGGSSIDRSSAMTMDASGNIYLTGDTESHNFPVTPTAYQATLQGTDNAFLAKVTSDGSTLVFSTLLGGSQTDQANALALDIAGNIYITGYTESSNFPHLDPFQNVLGISGAGNCGSTNLVNVPSVICPDAFVAKFGPSGIPTYSSFLGGSNADSGQGIAVDSSGAAYVVGQTFSTNFPTVAGETFSSNSPSVGGAYQWQYLGSSTNSNAFVTKVSPQDAPSVALNPQQIDFGKEPLLSPSTPVAVMLTNVGSAALNISSITASGDFQQTNNCGTSVPGGAGTCTIQITFDPKSVGQQTDQISITEPGSGSTTVTQAITVTGNGVLAGGSLLFSPTTLTFAAQPLGTTSAPQSALLINNGNQPVTITNITVGSGFAQTNTCGSNFPTVPATLNVGQTCTIFVSFSPINTGNVTGSVAIASNAVTTSAALQLAGTGSPVFSLSSNARSSVILIGSKTANFTISAAAPSTLQGAITLGCSTGASCTFSPSAIPPGGSSALTLTGLNASTANPLNFTVTGTSASQGSAAVSITVFFADYSLSASPSGSTVTAGNNATYTITLTPTNGFDQAVLLSCGALPAPSYTTCYWNPGGLSLSGTATASSTLTITTTAQSRLLRRPPPPTIPPGLPRWILFLALLTFLGAIITGYHQSGRGLRTRSTWAVLAMAMVLLALAVGCENYVNPININPSVVGTPSGTFSIVLTGTMGNGSGVSRSTTVNLSVLPNS
jgi:hypothetical protein